MAFDHPLYVLFSSGTTGLPKAIVHGHGGQLVEHHKNQGLGWDLKPGGRLLWFSTTAWMMWNALVSALLLRSSIVMLDGDPAWPDLLQQWRLAEELQPTVMGVSPPYLMACRKAGLRLGEECDLRSLRALCTAGSPLPAEGYRYVYEQLPPELVLINGSGGTDVCTGIVSGSFAQPVYEGEISGPCLGVDAHAFDVYGQEVVGELGELVITKPMPSMPVGLWGDADGARYRSSYFDRYPGVWRQGDWIRFEPRGSCVLTGRSDATLNRGGVRLGTGEFYAVIEDLPEVVDALVVHLEDSGGGAGELLLFVVAADDAVVDEALRRRIATTLRSELSPRHVPDGIFVVPAIPRTLTGKKLESPVKRILRGDPVEQVASRDSLADPAALDAFVALASERRAAVPTAPRRRPCLPIRTAVCNSMSLRFGRCVREGIDEWRTGTGWDARGPGAARSAASRTRAMARPRRECAAPPGVVGRRSSRPLTSRSRCVQTARTPVEFQGAVMRRRLGDLMLVDCAASPFLGLHRGGMSTPAGNENILGLQFVCKGTELVRERNREVALRPGDVVLWDGLQPTEVEIVEPFYKRTLMFPRDEVLALCPRLAEADALPALDRDGPARLLVRYMNALALELPQLETGARIAAANAALELLRAAVEPRLPTNRAAERAALRADIRRYVRTHLQDAGARAGLDRARLRHVGARAARPVRGHRRLGGDARPHRAARALPRGSAAPQRRVGDRDRVPLGILRRRPLLSRVQARVRCHAERGAACGVALAAAADN